MIDLSTEVRCPHCARLLGRRQNGGVEVQTRGRRLAVVERGRLVCPVCGTAQTVEPEQRLEFRTTGAG